MSGLYADDGSINVSIVDGTVITGLYADNGSWNVVIADGAEYVGVMHACGAFNVTVAEPGLVCPRQAPDGSLFVCEDPYDPTGALRVTAVDGAFGARILLSSTSVAESLSIGGTVGTFSVINGSGTYTFSLTADPENKFDVSGTNGVNLITTAALDWETDSSHSVTVQADNGVDTPITRTFTIHVTNVLEVTLQNLTLNTSTLDENSPEDTAVGSLQNVSSGSTLLLTNSAGSRFKLVGTNIVAGSVSTDFETATSHDITIRETHIDGNNSPRDSIITISINDVSEGGGGGDIGEIWGLAGTFGSWSGAGGGGTDEIFGTAPLFGTWS